MVAIVPFPRVIRMGIYSTTAARGVWLITRYQMHQNWRHGSNVMKSAQDDRLLSANDVINLIFKMAPRLIKRVYIFVVALQKYKNLKVMILARIDLKQRNHRDTAPLNWWIFLSSLRLSLGRPKAWKGSICPWNWCHPRHLCFQKSESPIALQQPNINQ